MTTFMIDINVMVVCNAVPGPLGRSKRFTLHPMADLFNPTLTLPFWESFSPAAITEMKTTRSHITPCLKPGAQTAA